VTDNPPGEQAEVRGCDDIQALYAAYQSALRERNAFDFDDLVLTPIDILQHDPSNSFRNRFTHIIVDEYQDINPAQYRFMKLLVKGTNDICVVGDPDQAIYAFRGADIGNFLRFETDFPGAKRVILSENYRSTGTILSAAGSLIANNRARIDKDVLATREQGCGIPVLSVPDERSEGDAIVEEIEARIGGTSHDQMRKSGRTRDFSRRSYRFSDFAVIFRTNAQAKALEEAFSASGIPYQVIGRKTGAQAKEIKETMAYLRSFLHGDGDGSPAASDDLETKLVAPADLFDPRADAVALMTMHMAKGLEFPIVFIAGCEDGLVPCTIMKDGADIEEERRLFYVGMTRAKDELVLLSSRKRFLYGQRYTQEPSPFLREIPERLIEQRAVPERIRKQKEPDPQMGLF
jgi:DNA helicase-2/ATP-dependent DNA helicase PcrA